MKQYKLLYIKLEYLGYEFKKLIDGGWIPEGNHCMGYRNGGIVYFSQMFIKQI